MTTQETKVEWGPEIAVHGKRPEWLDDEATIQVQSRYGVRPNWNTYRAGYNDLPWDSATDIRLRANHPHYAHPTPTDERGES